MVDKYIIALSDASGTCHVLATEISLSDERYRLDALMRRWTPEPSKVQDGKAVFTQWDILNSLKKMTGYTFYTVTANYFCTYQEQEIELPSLGEKRK